VNPLAAVAGLMLLTAGVVAALVTLGRAGASPLLVRGLALAATLTLLGSSAAAWPAITLGLVGGLEAAPLALLAAGASSLLPAFGGAGSALPISAAFAGIVAGVSAAALGATALKRLAGGQDPAWLAVAAGLLAAGVPLAVSRGGVLKWRWPLASPGAADPGGVGMLMGLFVLAALAGTLLLGAHALGGTAGSEDRARSLGRKLLVLATGFGVLAFGFGVVKTLDAGEPALAASARGLAWTALAVAALGLALLFELVGPPAATGVERGAWLSRLAAALAPLVLVITGAEAWWRQASYERPSTLAVASAALLSLAAREDTALALVRRAVALVAWLAVCL
jgi:hypothetical protein